jgi:V-type H+-transporting ATPase proteolipid subunit|tara:strand:- start:102 stop:668 length:567 start_codon:yes stop_codon:yes gene_type:complete
MTFYPYCPDSAPFFGFLGAAFALIFGNMGAAYGTWKSAIGLATMAKLGRNKVQTELVMKAIMPVILSGVCGIFGLIIAVIISSGISYGTGPAPVYSLYTGYAHLAAGLTVGLSNLASGLAIGMSGDCGVQDSARQPKLYIPMVLIWSFGSALGLYGLIVALIIATKDGGEMLCSCTSAVPGGPVTCSA